MAGRSLRNQGRGTQAPSPTIANPSLATAIALAVAPFVKAGLVRGTVNVAAATGSTGSGATPGRAGTESCPW